MSSTSKTPQKRLSMAKVKKAKHHLKNLQKKHHLSLRALAAKLGNAVTYQTLGRFISEKDYIPSDEKVRAALDLYADPNPYRGMPRWLERLPCYLCRFKNTREKISELSSKTHRARKGEDVGEYPHVEKTAR